jgi:hypothetical protein
VIIDDVELFVECYERLSVSSNEPPSRFKHGECLARLRAVVVSGAPIMASSRLSVSRKRLALAPLEIREALDPLFDIAQEVLRNSSGPMVLCHGD